MRSLEGLKLYISFGVYVSVIKLSYLRSHLGQGYETAPLIDSNQALLVVLTGSPSETSPRITGRVTVRDTTVLQWSHPSQE